MKRIILDHFRRWRWVLAACLIAYFAIQASYTHKDNTQSSDDQTTASIQHTINAVHYAFIFQAVMWLGFLLIWDLQRGLPRVLTSLPVTTKQIGRAWWLAAVALPAIALGIVGLFAVLIFSGGANITILLENYLRNWSLAPLYLGAAFGALTFMVTAMPDTFIERIRAISSNLLFTLTIFGVIFVQLGTLTPTQTQLIFGACIILSVLGWFRAERMVLQRVGFRLVAQSSSKKVTQYKIPQGFGGLPYLAQRTIIQSTLIGLTLFAFMILLMSFFTHGQDQAQSFISMVGSGSIPYTFYILIFSIVPIVFQLRFLRTLPVSPSILSATLVLLPVISIATVGVIMIAVTSFVFGEAVILPATNGFLMLCAKAAVMAAVVVWRGLDTLTYAFIFLLVIADSFISLGMTIIFHLRSKTPEHPWWVNLTIFLVCLAVSLVLTRRLLTKSSSAYRVRTMPTNSWSMARR